MSHSEAPFLWPVRVYYEDTDAAGVVYYANYLRYLERARTEWLRGLGVEQERLFQETGFRFAVSRLEILYEQPARLDDALTVSVAVTEVRRASMILTQEVRRNADDARLIFATVRIACLDGEFKPARLADALLGQPEPAIALLTGST
ncbi:MAG: tol-pal system-associated acyl-CoA thioesterase [Magnetococcales bacterium]|nr:tol-pal system-associated acyl-CoA thioesterase [Magnetococcales bacterium]